MPTLRHLVILFDDQIDLKTAALRGFDPAQDSIWIAESISVARSVWSTKSRICLFLSSLRQFRDQLKAQGWPVQYHPIQDRNYPINDRRLLSNDIERLAPQKLLATEPGEWHLKAWLEESSRITRTPLEIREDTHFLCTREHFEVWAEGRKTLRLEYFYRSLRQKHSILLDANGDPEGGRWNLDKENRGHFGKTGPLEIPELPQFHPGPTTRATIQQVKELFADHPGELEEFNWPTTRSEALHALQDFIQHRLPAFGTYQDAMWTEQPFLYHSALSAALNLKLLNPLEVVQAAENSYREGRVRLNAAEGFIRQILGWREYVRQIYWEKMPTYQDANAWNATLPLPDFFWTGETTLNCLSQALKQTLNLGYAHHIQRLMVIGNYALMLGVEPRQVHEWYLAVYVDAVEWVEMPNVLGMSQFADGGFMASKPYLSTGKYIHRMSNYCRQCPFDPNKATGEKACPFTTLYWDFLSRHRIKLSHNPRMSLALKNLEKLSSASEIHTRAEEIRTDPSGMKLAREDSQDLFSMA